MIATLISMLLAHFHALLPVAHQCLHHLPHGARFATCA
jgi:hypothetical protein